MHSHHYIFLTYKKNNNNFTHIREQFAKISVLEYSLSFLQTVFNWSLGDFGFYEKKNQSPFCLT